MPYQGGKRLPGEYASKLGHLEVIKSDLVNQLVHQFEGNIPLEEPQCVSWEAIGETAPPLRLIFAVDGSKQTVRSDSAPYKELTFVKTAMLRLDQYSLAKLDPVAPHPMALRDIMANSALYHATVFPLRGIRFKGRSNYDIIRNIIYESLLDHSLNGELFETLKWLAYEKWNPKERRRSPSFDCPHCGEETGGLPYDSNAGTCQHCGEDVYLSDMIGFHLEMSEDAAPESLASAYMLVHETLFLFTGIRFFWDSGKFKVLEKSLFIKDGPLTLRGQYSKLVIPIRKFFEYARERGVKLYVMGQEKTGLFVDHLEMIGRGAPDKSVFVPDNEYIRKEIQQRPERSESYGFRTNYGNKIFVKLDNYHKLVLSVPTGAYKDSKSLKDLIGIERILATLPMIVSHRHEAALVPVELANGVASLSSYPSATVLKMFADI